jgi:DNA-binding XRE family transcriptional regulator
MAVMTPNLEDQKRARLRAEEWRLFRRVYLFSQTDLADTLNCARRTIVSIESGETLNPHPDLLRRFRDLKRKMENGELRWA